MNQEFRIGNEKPAKKSFILPGNLLAHHAYTIEGGAEIKKELFEVLENSWKISTKGNPDFSYRRFLSLGVEEARLIKDDAQGKSFGAGKKIFIIDADSITTEAQNSLLKILEEPTPDTHFFIIGGCVKNLIPTLNSRVQIIRTSMNVVSDADSLAQEFMRAPISKRLSLIKKLTDDIKDEKKPRAEALALLQEIETIVYKATRKEGKLPDKILTDLEMCREYMNDRSAGIKMILEYVALTVPILRTGMHEI